MDGARSWAERMIPLIGRLYRENGVVVTIFDRSLVLRSPIDILKAHRFARHMLDGELSIELSSSILEALGRLELAPSRIDIGKLPAVFRVSPPGRTWRPSCASTWRK